MARALVIGGGQIGAFVSAALERHGHQVEVADQAPAIGFFKRYGARSVETILPLDVTDAGSVDQIFAGRDFDTVILTFGVNGAAFADATVASQSVNVDGPSNVARAAIAHNVRTLVFLSSFAVYGRQTTERIDEETPPEPQFDYGRAKLDAEAQLTEITEGKLDLVILRPAGVFGPVRVNRGSHSARLLDSLLLAASQEIEVTLEWSETDKDEYVYVKDLAEAVARAAAPGRSPGVRIFNVGGASQIGVQALVTAVTRIFPEFSARLKEVTPRHKAPMPILGTSRIRDALGFTPTFGLDAGLEDQARITGLLK